MWEPGNNISDLRRRSHSFLLEVISINCLPFMDILVFLVLAFFLNNRLAPCRLCKSPWSWVTVTSLYLVLEFIFSDKFVLLYSKYLIVSLI